MYSPAGNRTPVSRVTGGDTHHYTTEEATGNSKFQYFSSCTIIRRKEGIFLKTDGVLK